MQIYCETYKVVMGEPSFQENNRGQQLLNDITPNNRK